MLNGVIKELATVVGGSLTAMACIDIMGTVRKEPFWRREKVWKQEFENSVVNEIVIPIENKIKEKENEY